MYTKGTDMPEHKQPDWIDILFGGQTKPSREEQKKETKRPYMVVCPHCDCSFPIDGHCPDCGLSYGELFDA